MEKENIFSKPEKQEKGLNVKVRSFYFRHAEKASGIVGSGSNLSKSLISEKGKEDSIELGKHIENPARDGYKIGWSGNERTLQTGEAETEGYLGEEERKKFVTREKLELSEKNIPKEAGELYFSMWGENKKKILDELGIKTEDYEKLSPDKQAEIAEKAEEPVTSEWVDNNESELAKLYPQEKAAAHIAVLVRRDIKTPEKLVSGSSVDLFRITHKTITEPLLMKIIILENGEKPKKLEDIGGSLGLNEGWEIDSMTDENGEKSVKLFLYRVGKFEGELGYIKKEYNIDLEELERLADLGVELENRRMEEKLKKA